ncbi:MAG: flavodoxin domain-containing protein [Oscillospiraceae bacterium]|nr:flavodoxin domain-containing protein [Oscillospiraceae bacterium]
MKTIILYATKHGATAEIAQRIVDKIGDAILHDLKQPTPDLTEYDCIIIGSAIYAGAFRKEAKAFLSQSSDILKAKKLAIFASGMSKGESDKIFTENVPTELLQAAKAAMLLGGVFDPKKANFAERLIMKVVTKQSGYVDTIDDNKITEFVDALV